MLTRIFLFFMTLSPVVKRSLWHWWYQWFANYYQKPDLTFMNYGLVNRNPEEGELYLDEADEKNRYFIQLYHYVAATVDLPGKKVLEVGSGRGGGAAYIARYLKPEMIVGIDFSENNIQLARQFYQLPNLSFQQGNAEELPFENEIFDVVLNVESSHCYRSQSQFFKEVNRVLKPGGVFAWADFRSKDDLADLQQSFANSGFKQIQSHDITGGVLQALDLINERKKVAIETSAPRFLKGAFQEFAALKDSKMYEAFQTSQIVYLSYVLQKAANC